MFKEDHYVPILKWKRGEQKALEFLDSTTKASLTPLIEIVPIPYDYANECPAKSIDDHLKNVADQIETSWIKGRPIFLDLNWPDDSERMADGRHPIEYIIDEARVKEMKIIPVVGTERSSEYKEAVKETNKKDSLGVCIRLEDEDFLDVESRLTDLLVSLEVSPSLVDLVLDFKYISPGNENKSLISIVSTIKTIPHIQEWRTFILSCSGFPVNLSGLAAKKTHSLPRSEWIIWRTLNNMASKLPRIPSFSDYGISNPIHSEIDPRIMTISGSLRYTAHSEWLVFKGAAVKKVGWEQMRVICDEVIKSPQYSGEKFSWGDKNIHDCAKGDCGTGNAETWRRVGTNHHLSFVANQIASLFSVSTVV